MKVLPILVTNTAVVLSALLTLGCQSVQVTTSRDIDRSVETTWEVFADAENLGTWMHATWDRQAMDWADVDPGTIGESRLVRFEDEGEVMELTQTIISVKPNEEFRYTFDHEWADTDFLFLFEPTGPDRCTITWEFTAHPKGWHGVWMNVARGSMKARFNSHLDKLEELVESQP